VGAKLLLEHKQAGLGVHLEGERIKGVPLVAAAVAVELMRSEVDGQTPSLLIPRRENTGC
jgi:hypothetical protein